ncbi:MAG: hypothetical protein UX91_C0015G0008 [Candidatus Amesbacteria bacterium GW2011_GWB1_47_19]|nr:MAG: hypothetical protein UX91_C0015G0008 [Candidatus Amesbacteria bacterium GW2011_GWB1_47_19]
MLADYKAENWTDPDKNPTGGAVHGVGLEIKWQEGPGGAVHGVGLEIKWQEGPLGRGTERKEPNGAFVETVIDACRQRIQFYQDSKFKCRENAIAITKLEEALMWLNKRTTDREKRQVEGEHKI